ncbi:MAG TPA: TMEM175 family protein, partial [Pyrinomonadaceae bacterium]
MIREKVLERGVGSGLGFRWRSHEISRIEGLSDAVFAFAVTLLVVSLEVPKTFNELAEAMHGFGAFAISFALLFLVWFNQYKFFRRYGLQDTATVLLNAVLLFVVLFYVYPLKFLFSFLINKLTGGHGEVRLPNGNFEPMIENTDQMSTLMTIFGVGYLAVFLVFVALYSHAYRKRRELNLDQLEVFDTRSSINESALNCGIALVSICLALLGGRFSGFAGPVYMLTAIVMGVNGTITGKRRRRLERSVTSTPQTAETGERPSAT